MSRRKYYSTGFVTILLLQALLYALDSQVRFFLSDSASYLATSQLIYTPTDRTFIYGVLIKLVTAGTNNLNQLVLFQVATFSVTCMGMLAILREYLRCKPALAMGLTLVASVLPTHVLWTRYVMTETSALFWLTALILLAMEYLRSGRLLWLVPLSIAGTIALAFRLVMIPPVIALAFLPVLSMLHRRPWAASRDAELRRAGVHLLASLVLVFGLHSAYKSYVVYRHSWANKALPKSYSYEDGYFLLGFVAPLLQPEDLPKNVDPGMLLCVEPDLYDPRNRNAMRFGRKGLIARLAEQFPDEKPGAQLLLANQAARDTAHTIIARDPKSVVGLAIETLCEFWDAEHFERCMRTELGLDRDPDARFLQIMERSYGLEATTHMKEPGRLQKLFLGCSPYVSLLAFAFLLVPPALFFQRRSTWVYFLLPCGLLLYFNLVGGFFAMLPSARFMQPVSWLMFLFAGGFALQGWPDAEPDQ